MHTKQQTILYINHAISFFKNQGKTQKDMAKILGLDESRISEMKVGRSYLSTSDMNSIIELCGHPRRDPGRYERAQCYQSCESFFSEYNNLMKNRYLRGLIDYFNDEKNKKNLLDSCRKLPIFKSNELSTLADIDDFIRQSESNTVFSDYLSKCLSQAATSMWAEDPMNYEGFIVPKSSSEKELFHSLFQLWQLVSEIESFYLSNEDKYHLPLLKDSEEVVMTGDTILAFANGASIDRSVNEFTNKTLGIESKYRINESSLPTYWISGRCEVILSDSMNYYFTIHLSQKYISTEMDLDKYTAEEASIDLAKQLAFVHPDDLFVIIEQVEPQSLFKDIEDIRKWFCLPEDSHFELKKNIAKAGGYVPGARVLV